MMMKKCPLCGAKGAVELGVCTVCGAEIHAPRQYTRVKTLSDQLIGVTHPIHGKQMWSLCEVRGDRPCSNCRKTISKGEPAFGPVNTAAGNRDERLHEECV